MKMVITLITFLLAFSVFEAHSAEYDLLCTDLAKKYIQDKINFVNKRKLSPAKKVMAFKSIPAVLSSRSDFYILNLLGMKNRSVMKSKNFDEKLKAEEKTLALLQKHLKANDAHFLNVCNSVYTQIANTCEPFLKSKNFAKFSKCNDHFIGSNSPYLLKKIPFLRFLADSKNPHQQTRRISNLKTISKANTKSRT